MTAQAAQAAQTAQAAVSAGLVLYVRASVGLWHVLCDQERAYCGRMFWTAARDVTYAADRPPALCAVCARYAPAARPDPQREPLAYRRWLLEQWDALGVLVWPADQEPYRRVLFGPPMGQEQRA